MNRRFKSLRWLALGTVVVAFTVVGVVLAATVVIDAFNDGTQDLTANTGTPSDSSSVSLSDGIGSYRDAVASHNSGGNNVNLTIDTSDSNELALSIGASTSGSAEVTWDGDNDAGTLDYDGLNNYDLVDSIPTNAGIYVVVETADHLTDLTFTAYDDNASDYGDMTIRVNGDSSLDRLDLFYPFTSFTENGSWSNASDWASMGALVLDIDGTLENELDLVIDFIEARPSADIREYGDLPDTGTPNYSDEILAYHVPSGLTLGYDLDAESSDNAATAADGDDNSDFSDEDGVTPQNLDAWVDVIFSNVGQGTVQFIVNGCTSGTCYVNAWLDMNRDGDFNDSPTCALSCPEHIVSDAYADGTHSENFWTPLDTMTDDQYYYARFRVCNGSTDCDNPGDTDDTAVSSGEVEDYRWAIGNPTAVTLASFEATPQDDAILVTWETAMELDNVGFNLYRSAAADEPYTLLNDTLIPPQFPGEAMGGTYEWLDADVQPGVIYFYKLEDIDVKGVSTFHGPVNTSVVAAPTVVALQSISARGALLVTVILVLPLAGFTLSRRRRR